MELTPKTDNFIKLFRDTIDSLNTEWIDIYRKHLKEHKELIGELKEKVRLFTLGLTKSYYSSLKLGDFLKKPDIYTISEDELFNNYLEDKKELHLDAALIGLKTNVSYKDMGIEFWCLCPNIESLNEYINVFRVKYKKIKNIPDSEDYELGSLILAENEIGKRIQYLQSLDIITKLEYENICKKMYGVAFNVWCIDKSIADMFNSYKEMADKPDIPPATIPKELDNPQAMAYLEKAIEIGLMSTIFKWEKGFQLLSCFAQIMSDKLDLGTGLNNDGTKRIAWKPFEELFHVDSGKLRNNFNDIKKTGTYPSDYSLLKQVFND